MGSDFELQSSYTLLEIKNPLTKNKGFLNRPFADLKESKYAATLIAIPEKSNEGLLQRNESVS